jgi:hypothetical protein
MSLMDEAVLPLFHIVTHLPNDSWTVRATGGANTGGATRVWGVGPTGQRQL